MQRKNIGTSAFGIKCPIVKAGDNIVNIVTDSIVNTVGNDLKDGDIIGITESIVARAEGNYATVDDIARDIVKLYGENATIGLVCPILSRNRFSLILKGIARAAKKVVVFLTPVDEVGNSLFQTAIESNDMHYSIYNEAEMRRCFGNPCHPITGVDYVRLYDDIITAENAISEIYMTEEWDRIIEYTNNILICTIRDRDAKREALKDHYNCRVHTLANICERIVIDGANSEGTNVFGVLGSNKAGEELLKLLPNHSECVALKIQELIKERVGKQVEVLIYGDGAYKDPDSGIWELADPVSAAFYTGGLDGSPHEVKIKYVADNDFSNLSGDTLDEAVKEAIREKKSNQQDMGTTPRKIYNLVASLCDLISGSGDKGTPIVLIQGYFNNYASY